MANLPEVFTTEAAEAAVEIAGGAGKHVEPALFGILAPYQIVSVAMLILIGIMIWKKVPAVVLGGLDRKIAAIREQLDEAKALRAEAEALRAEYAAKIAGAEEDAAAMMDNARREAEAVLAKAEADSAAMVERRKAMAESKIAGAEREAIADVRARAAEAAAHASRSVIAEKYDAAADRVVADEVIAAI